MYPKNAASPEPIAIGAVVQISNGAVQISGCTVRIKPIGVAEGDGAGTVAYSTDGIVYYTPTQAETNYTSFILIAKKTGCIPVAITVVTTSSATPGTVLLAPVTHTSAVIPTVTTTGTATNVTTVNGLAANVITAASIAADAITDAKVASDVTIASVTGAVGSVTGNVGGNVVGSVGSVVGHTPQTGDSYPIVSSGLHGNAALKTLVEDVPTNAELAAALAAADDAILSAITTLHNLSAAEVNAEVLDVVGNDLLVAGVTIKEALRRQGAILSGKVTGATTGTETFKDYAESASTIVITVDSSGNRSAIMYN